MISRFPSFLIMSQLRPLFDGITRKFIFLMAETMIFIVVDVIISLISSGPVLLRFDRRCRWLKSLHWAPRLILEEIIIVVPRSTLLAIFYGCATKMDARLDLSRQQIWSAFTLAMAVSLTLIPCHIRGTISLISLFFMAACSRPLFSRPRSSWVV